jgi:salicylate hydroxylase
MAQLFSQSSLSARSMVKCSRCQGEGFFCKKAKKARHSHKDSSNMSRPDCSVVTTMCKKCAGTGLCVRDSVSPNLSICEGGCDVLIVGGGIGGCALALALQQRKISVRVYERDISIDDRSQGYGLTMQQVIYTNGLQRYLPCF